MDVTTATIMAADSLSHNGLGIFFGKFAQPLSKAPLSWKQLSA